MAEMDGSGLGKPLRALLGIRGNKEINTDVNSESSLQPVADVSQGGFALARYRFFAGSNPLSSLPLGKLRHLCGAMTDSDIPLFPRKENGQQVGQEIARILACRIYLFYTAGVATVNTPLGIRFGFRLPGGNYQYFHGNDNIYLSKAGWPTYSFGLYGDNYFNPPGVGLAVGTLAPFTQSIIVPPDHTLFAESMGSSPDAKDWGAEIWAVTVPAGTRIPF